MIYKIINNIAYPRQELLQEGRTAYSGTFDGYPVCITIDGNMKDTNFKYDPYFKIYDNTDFGRAKHVARVFVDAKPDMYYYPRYTDHPNGAKKLWVLNADEKRMINDICRELIIGYDGHRRSVWGEILHAIEAITGLKNLYYPQPDYSKLVYMDTKNNKKNQKDPNRKIYPDLF